MVERNGLTVIPETARKIVVPNVHVRLVGTDADGQVVKERTEAGTLEVRRLTRSEIEQCLTAADFKDRASVADQERLMGLQVRLAIVSAQGLMDEFGDPVAKLRENHPVLGSIASVAVFDALSEAACTEIWGFCISGLRVTHAKNSSAPRGTSPGGVSPNGSTPQGMPPAPLPMSRVPAMQGAGVAAASSAGAGPAGDIDIPGAEGSLVGRANGAVAPAS